MKLVDKYIAKTILAAITLVTIMLAGLQVFILFVNQLDDLGKGDFGIIPVTWYVLLQTPYQIYLFFPMASLLACLVGLGQMASHRELIVMRAAGMSIAQITFSVLKIALLVIIVVTFLGETIVPPMSAYADDIKMQAISKGQTLRTANGIWLRYQNDYIRIDTVSNNFLENVYQYQFDENHRMHIARHIRQIEYRQGVWNAKDIKETVLWPKYTETRVIPDMVWNVQINPAIFAISSSEPDEMNLHQLRRFLREQKRTRQNADNYQLAFWQRIFQPLTTMVMMLLAIPFIFGPLRSSSMGSKLLAGAMLGFGFHIVNRFFGPVSQVLQWPPLLAALGPTVLFSLPGIYLMRRMR